jgi:anti-anti-sigma regulatory factor
MSLQVETTKVEPDIVVAHLSGSLTLGETEELTSLVGDLLVRGEKKLIFDLSGIRQIDSVGSVTIVRCFFAAKEVGSQLRFCKRRRGCDSPLQEHAPRYCATLRFRSSRRLRTLHGRAEGGRAHCLTDAEQRPFR